MKTVALITFGCAKNLVDSEVMAGYLEQAGFALVADPKKADIVILNTCGFIQPSKAEADEAILEALRRKRKSGSQKIVVTGCYAERYKPVLKEKYPEVDAWIGVKDFDKIVSVIKGGLFSESGQTFLYSDISPRAISTPSSWAYLKISEGCSHQCAFCAIPLIKGAYQSRDIASIVKETETLACRGIKEINLISQDTTCFGTDRGLKNGLARLLQKMTETRGLDWIRVLYGYPEEITDMLLEVMQDPKICPYFDIPFQHADTALVRKMRRAMDGERALKLIKKIRQKISDAAIRTSLLVGFPGEGRTEFQRLVRFVEEARFDHLGVFTYSREDGTSAYPLGDPIKETVKQKRKNEILEIQAAISAENLKKYLGRRLDVLIEGAFKDNSNLLVGRIRTQAPEVDGVVFVDMPGEAWDARNPIQKVEILTTDVYDLHGKFTR
jgi:ribosomal protein S12 methylthiotransferase